MSPLPNRAALLSAAFAARTGAWIQSIERLNTLTNPDQSISSQCRHVHSRKEFDEIALVEIQRAHATRGDVTLAVLDIDHLSAVNQDYGFDTGDMLIEQTEREIVKDLRPADTIVSLGSGTWAVLLPIIPGSSVHSHLEKMRNYIQRRLAIYFATNAAAELTVATISAGLVISKGATLSLPAMLQAASQASLESKLHGGNRTTTWSESTDGMVGRSEGRRQAQRDAQLSTVLSLAEALDLRDTDTSNHSTMVSHYAEEMARELGMDEERVERVRVAGLLHDIGKIGVPDSVLRKPAKLDDSEWEQMKAHPNIGAHLLSSMNAEDIRSWVLAHHERPDGAGYPLGLTDKEIPIEAKILSVADAYEAMTVDRVYRKAPGPEVARAELERLRGIQFDDDVVTVFLRILDRAIEHYDSSADIDSLFDDGFEAAA